jgi:hydroxyethylthiazole kinase-like uncharacterized protein yjeF
MRRIGSAQAESLYGTPATRAIEGAASNALPPHSLMALAGLSVAQLARALAPHAACTWIACGPGNNGGDGLIAAMHLQRQAQASGVARQIVVTLCAESDRLPADATNALSQARAAGVTLLNDPPAHFDFAIDALLGIGPLRPAEGRLAAHMALLQDSAAAVLSVDVPSGLHADTGVHLLGPLARRPRGPRHTLSLLTLKPGLFTGDGRDQAGQVWFDDLGITPPTHTPVRAVLNGMAMEPMTASARAHASHKGSQGDVLVIGGQDIGIHGAGMTGAAILAARAALHSGAGRVYVGLLTGESHTGSTGWDPACPELMFRHPSGLLESDLLAQSSVVCGCGGGSAVAEVLPRVLAQARTLVLDADALNAIAADTSLQTLLRHRNERGLDTVITPHPLEAARLLGCNTAEVMADRLNAAQQLVERFGATCVLKGSGSVICAPGFTPRINPTGNAALATAGTGDVLAGMIGCALTASRQTPDHALQRVAAAVFQHGWLADQWDRSHTDPAATRLTLTASRLANSARPLR